MPQVDAAVIAHCVAGVGAWPDAIGEQVPIVPVRAHEMQVQAQALLQQTPWAQNPDAQAVPTVQVAPGGSLPQELGETQSVLIEQVVLQAPVPHSNGSHMTVVAARQVPAPSQVRAWVSVDPVHDAAAPQVVPAE